MVEQAQILDSLPEGSKVLSQKYLLIKTLGKGSYSKVKLARWLEKDILVAIKLHSSIEQVDVQQLNKEVAVLTQLPHENVIKFFDCEEKSIIEEKVEGQWVEKKTCYCTVVLEYAEGMELSEYLASSDRLTEPVAKFIFKELIACLKFLHSNEIAHRDIKPDNILFNQEFKLKVADFGFVGQANQSDGLFRTYCGTPQFMAPEVHMIWEEKDNPEVSAEELKYEGPPVDVFAAGIILFNMWTGFNPFRKADLNDPAFILMAGEEWEKYWDAIEGKCSKGFDEGFKDLVKGMLSPDPEQRLTAEEVLKSEWLKTNVATSKQAEVEL